MSCGPGGRILKILVIIFALAITLNAGVALAQEAELGPLEEIKALQSQAKKLGAKGQLSMAWRQLDSHLGFAEENGANEAQWAKIRQEATLLLNQASFLNNVRQKKNSEEVLLGRFDQALLEIATLFGVALDPVQSGTPQAELLLDDLSSFNLRRQVQVDSLTVANRHLNEVVGGQVAAQDSLITALSVQVRSLRQQLWETELRAGVAEADRSAAETVLTTKQAREELMTSLHASISPEEGEILLVGNNRIVMHLHGLSFAVGSSQLKGGQGELLAKVSDAVALFPGAQVMVEGHTDTSGSRQANLRLSRRRAETVARTLEKMQGWDKNRISTEGLGPDRPVALNDTAQGRARNRRIDLIMELPQ